MDSRLLEENLLVHYGTKVIPFDLDFAKRKTLSISVHPDGNVKVKAPINTNLDKVKEIVLKRARWIVKKQEHFNKFPPPIPARKYISGESFRYLGRQYKLKVERCIINKAKLYEGNLTVFVTKVDQERVKMLVEEFYAKKAEIVFKERFEVCLEKVKKLGVAHNGELKTRKMKSRWGSCRSNGNITLNLRLIEAPKECIDYVIIHELCHLKEMNHSKKFYALLEKIIPDWKERKEKLNQIVNLRID